MRKKCLTYKIELKAKGHVPDRQIASCRWLPLLILVLVANGPRALAADFDASTETLQQVRQAFRAQQPAKAAKRQSQTWNKSEARKLGKFVQSLHAKYLANETPSTDSILKSSMFVRQRSQNQVQVYLSVRDTSQTTLTALTAMGAEIEVINKELNKVQAWISLSDLDEFVGAALVQKITTPNYAQPRSGSVTTEGDRIHKANQLRSLGLSGRGVKVGIVSDGANNFSAATSSGDLPATLTRFGSCSRRAENQRNCSPELTCNEGTAMAEIIHDIAPQAELAVAAVSTSLEFIQRINQLANNFKADIIVDDLGFFGEPYFEDGDLAQAVAALPARVLYVSAAGNSAHTHYQEQFRRFPDPDFDLHDFGAAAGQASFDANGFTVGGGRGVVTILQWNDRYNSPSNDYDLFVVDDSQLLGRSIEDQGSGAPAIEATCTFNPSSTPQAHFAIVNRFSGSSRRIKMYFLGASNTQFNTTSGSVFGHPGVKRALAIGAINASDPGNDNVTFYSSRGPARIDFPARSLSKPDLMGIDGVRVTGAGGFPSRFFGTSAAAPHVAGVAALLFSASSAVKADDVRTALIQSATDLGPGGRDNTFGFGRVDALAAKQFIKTGVVTPQLLLLLLNDEEQ